MHIVVVLFLLAIGPLALLFGADSRENVNSPEPQRVQAWLGGHRR